MRRVAAQENVLLIDLNRKSVEIYDSLGLERTRASFVDETHSNETGAFDFARFVAEEVKRSKLPIAGDVIDELPPAKMK